jgi:hypothetical protein
MALSHVSKVYAITSAKVAKMTADIGGATYGTSIVVPGSKKLGTTPEIQFKELRGDNSLMDSDSVLQGLRGRLDYAKLSLDVLNTILGTAAVVDTGVTPNQVSTLSLLGNLGGATPSVPNYFKLEAKSLDADVITGDVHYVFYKCRVTGFEVGLNEEDYQTFWIEFATQPRLVDGKWMDIVFNETAAAIA